MKRSFLDSVLRGAEALAARDPVGTVPDPDLVRRFAAGRDPAAFAVLVRRHGPLVWGVCRNLLPADADAEDAFQATFLALCRSAGSIRRTEALGGWLHGVAYRVALKARRAAARRKKREVVAALPEPSSPVPDAAWDELQAAVHEEVCQLPDKLRLPFVLCGLQGRPQKEAAAVLGWKVGTVSGRLSEARRVLLDRLARRGVPAAVGLGAAVLGGVAGQAAVPASIRLKVLSVAGEPATVSETVLSLARGVTPMYLTRTKLLAAGLVLVGILTTSAGVLSTADAQGQPGPSYEDAVRKYYDALRATPTPKDRWEYKFLPVDKPLNPAELRVVLSRADGEGWTYCGSQDLAADKTGKVTQHMVFKRPTTGGVAESAPADRAAVAAALAELAARDLTTKMRAEQDVRRQQVEAERARAEAATQEAVRNRKVAEDRAAVERERQDLEAKVRAEAEKALLEATRVRDHATQAERAAREQEAARRKELEALKSHYEKLIEELKAKTVPDGKRPNPLNKKQEPQAGGNPFAVPADRPVTARVPLEHVDGKTAAEYLAKVFPAAKIVAEATPKSITLTGPSEQVFEARGIVQKLIDLPAVGSAGGGTAEPAYQLFRLKHVMADEVAKAVEKAMAGKGAKFLPVQATNTLLAFGTPAELADVRKLVTALDAEKGPAK